MEFVNYFIYSINQSFALFHIVLAFIFGASALIGAIYCVYRVIQSDLHLSLKIIIPIVLAGILALIGVFVIPLMFGVKLL